MWCEGAPGVPPLCGKVEQGRDAFIPEFFLDAPAVCFYSFAVKLESVCHFLGAGAFTHHQEHGKFAMRQLIHGLLFDGAGTFGDLVKKTRRHGGAEIGFITHKTANAIQYVIHA